MPRVTSRLMYSKWGVSPRITAPRQMTASNRPDRASWRATRGISNAPVPDNLSIHSVRHPAFLKAFTHSVNNRLVTNLLNLLATIPTARPVASWEPLRSFMGNATPIETSHGLCVCPKKGDHTWNHPQMATRFRPHQVVGF